MDAIDSVINDRLIVSPIAGRTVVESSSAVRGMLPISGRTPRGALTMQLVDSRGRVVADLATYSGSSVQLSLLTGATRLQITLPGANTPMAVAGVR